MPYPDEMFYSIVARYQAKRNLSKRALLKELFGSEKSPKIDLPTRIDCFTKNSVVGQYFNSEYIVEKHTLFPYYTAFVSSEDRNRLLSMMVNGGRIRSFGRNGILFWEGADTNSPQYCPECVAEDDKGLGEAYWHRVHQVPGIAVCPTHNVQLRDSCPICGVKIVSDPHYSIVAISKRCINGHDITEINKSIIPFMGKCRAYAQDCLELLRTEFRCEPSTLKQIYRTKLKDLRLAGIGGKPNQVVREFLLKYIDQQYVSEIAPSFENVDNWIFKALNAERNVHPFKHLHMIRALFGSFDQILNAPTEYMPFGQGPWPCLNPLSDHFKQRVITRHGFTNSYGKWRGVFLCDCGYEYTRWLGDDEFSYRRIMKLGHVWEQRIIEIRTDPALTLAEVGEKIGVSNLRDYGLDGINKRKKVTLESQDSGAKVQIYRDVIDNIVGQFPNLKRSDIHKLHRKEYDYLLKNDREWLMAKLPKSIRGAYLKTRANYSKRDKEYAGKIQDAYKTIINNLGKPRRAFKAVLLRQSKTWHIRAKAHKYPEAILTLNALVENEDDFHIRSIKWAAENLHSTNDTVSEENIRNLIGIRKPFSTKTQDFLQTLLL